MWISPPEASEAVGVFKLLFVPNSNSVPGWPAGIGTNAFIAGCGLGCVVRQVSLQQSRIRRSSTEPCKLAEASMLLSAEAAGDQVGTFSERVFSFDMHLTGTLLM